MITIKPGALKATTSKLGSFFNNKVEREIAKPNYFSKAIHVSEELPADVFNSIQEIKTSVIKVAEKNGLFVDFYKAAEEGKVNMVVATNKKRAPRFATLEVNPSKTEDSFARSVFKNLSDFSGISITDGLAVHLK